MLIRSMHSGVKVSALIYRCARYSSYIYIHRVTYILHKSYPVLVTGLDITQAWTNEHDKTTQPVSMSHKAS